MSVTETERPEVFWVDATSKHVVDAMNGKDVEARFRNRADFPWTSVRKFKGWSKFNADDWFHDGSRAWNFCQVYEPESWWLKRPDPGPGWRLLGKFPDEEPKPGDECFGVSGEWGPSCQTKPGGHQVFGVWYRRRIERLLSGHRWLVSGDRLESGDLYYEKGSLLEVGHEYWGNNVMLAEAFMRKIEQPKPEPKYKVDDRVRIIGPVPGCTLVGRIVRVKSKRLSVLDDGSSAWFYTVENIYEYVVREDYLAPAPPAPPSHPMCRCEIAPETIKPVEGAAHYPKIGDTIFLPEMGRLKVLARGFEAC
jgi:hypothetical protein